MMMGLMGLLAYGWVIWMFLDWQCQDLSEMLWLTQQVSFLNPNSPNANSTPQQIDLLLSQQTVSGNS